MEMMAAIGITGANFYPARGFSGDAAGDLDHIDGAGLNNNDVGCVVAQDDATWGDMMAWYVLDDDADCGGTNLPHYIRPASNFGTKCWVLVKLFSQAQYGAIEPETDANGETVTEEQAYGGVILETGDEQTILLPDSATGMNFCVIADAAIEIRLDSNANDNFEIDGVTGDNGDYIYNSTSAKGDFACVYSIDGTSWVLMGRNGTWAAEPA